jgi:hypothetical protein
VAFYLQAAVLGKGYDNLGLFRPVSHDLSDFPQFKDGGRFTGDKDYPAPLYSAGYTLPPFQRYFVY